MKRDRIEPIVSEVLAASPRRIAAAWLYGSIARGDEQPDSDVDVALFLTDGPTGTLDDVPAELESELSKRLGAHSQCLSRTIVIGSGSLRHSLAESCAHYTRERPHHGIGNVLIEPSPRVGTASGRVVRDSRLGGLLSYYHRLAA